MTPTVHSLTRGLFSLLHSSLPSSSFYLLSLLLPTKYFYASLSPNTALLLLISLSCQTRISHDILAFPRTLPPSLPRCSFVLREASLNWYCLAWDEEAIGLKSHQPLSHVAFFRVTPRRALWHRGPWASEAETLSTKSRKRRLTSPRLRATIPWKTNAGNGASRWARCQRERSTCEMFL